MNVIEPLRKTGIATAVFLLMSLLPQYYDKANGNCPSFKTRIMQFVAYIVVIILAIKYLAKVDKSYQELAGYALYAGLLFFFLSSSDMYRLTDSLFGEYINIANFECPTFSGILIHAVVFAASMAVWQTTYPNQNILA